MFAEPFCTKTHMAPEGTVGYGNTPICRNWQSHYQYADDSLAVDYIRAWNSKIVSEFTVVASQYERRPRTILLPSAQKAPGTASV